MQIAKNLGRHFALLLPVVALLVSACARAEPQLEVVVEGLTHPWGVAFVDRDRILISEKSGNLRLWQDGSLSAPLSGVPEVDARGQGGLLDVAYRDGWVYFSYAEPGATVGRNSTAVARGRLEGEALTDVSVIFRQLPRYPSRGHFGSRLAFSPQGHLFITLGDRQTARDDAQTLDNHHGKVIRIWPDGRVPEDNPYADQQDGEALPEIWSYGHRNVQGAAIHPQTGELWTHEHGPRGGDEVNVTRAAVNHGWPVITYGEEYRGGKIGVGTHKAGMAQPLHYWVPSIAPSGMAFSTSGRYPQWQGDLFVGSLKFQQLVRLDLESGRVVKEQRLFEDSLGQRLRDVVEGPDGLLYLLTDDRHGRLLRVRP